MYIKKAERELIKTINEYVDSYNSGIKEFRTWLNSNKIYLCLKKEKMCKCTYCQNEFKTDKKINENAICPFCKKRLLIKQFNNRCFEEKNYYSILIPYEDKYLARVFEIYSYLTSTGKTENNILEIERQIILDNGALGFCEIISSMKKNTGGYFYIEYWNHDYYWKPSPYHRYAFYKKFYPDNIDDVLKAKYFSIKEVIEKVDNVNICDLITGVKDNNYSLEILIKAKLYNLATEYYEFEPGNFESTFGIDKSYFKFMQENDITKGQLDVLKLIKIKDIELIKYYENIYWRLDDLFKYCNPVDFYNYHLKEKDLSEYLDYLDMAKKLGYDLKDKKYLYPKKLKEEHDKLQHIININKSKLLNRKIKQRYKKLLINQFSDNKYIVFPAASVDDLINESKQMNNCVKTYAERYANGICDIYFMRLLTSKEISLVTIEVRDNKVVQKRTKNNAITNRSQNLFIKKWEKRLKGEKLC